MTVAGNMTLGADTTTVSAVGNGLPVQVVHDQLDSGNGDRHLLVRQVRTIRIRSVRDRPVADLKTISNTMAANQEACLSVTWPSNAARTMTITRRSWAIFSHRAGRVSRRS